MGKIILCVYPHQPSQTTSSRPHIHIHMCYTTIINILYVFHVFQKARSRTFTCAASSTLAAAHVPLKMTKYVQIKTKFHMKSLCVVDGGNRCSVKYIYTRVELLKTKLYILFVMACAAHMLAKAIQATR